MTSLPSVSAIEIKHKLSNYQEKYSSLENRNERKQVNVISKLNEIFSSSNHVYKSRVKIYLRDKILEKVIIGKTNTEVLCLDKSKIKIIDILDIEKL